jgi:hypothetical protein
MARITGMGVFSTYDLTFFRMERIFLETDQGSSVFYKLPVLVFPGIDG